MNDYILRLKHWQLFCFLLVPHVASWFTNDVDILSIFNFLKAVFLMSWLVYLVNAMGRLGVSVHGYNFKWFLVDVFIFLAAVGYSSIIDDPMFHVTTTSFKGKNAGFLLSLYVVFAYFHVHWFITSLLEEKETGQLPDATRRIGTFLLFLFWPIGIWFIQPRINRLWERQMRERQALEEATLSSAIR
ncbi:hypothetical protein [Hymenobacter sp. BT730]|uniref:hypothetical protein n=1 Tax=Hymenobacter sp. BT730 TaxID=3063332 RepID=UPI0026E0B721|nr:hypothetical protein [Hymenobacter sp. BT730]